MLIPWKIPKEGWVEVLFPNKGFCSAGWKRLVLYDNKLLPYAGVFRLNIFILLTKIIFFKLTFLEIKNILFNIMNKEKIFTWLIIKI